MRKAAVLFILLALMFPGFAYSAGPCGDFEYAELQDMDQESFLKEFCKARESSKTYIERMIRGGRREISDARSCLALLDKMERIYMKRFNIDTPDTLRGMCK